MEDYYKTLKVHPKATQVEIRDRFRFLANAYHPDKFASPVHKAQAEAEFKKINEAYQVLSVPQKRAEYDRSIRLPHASWVENEGQPGTKDPANVNSPLSLGRWVITAVAALLLLYLAVSIAGRIGIWGLILLLMIAGVLFFGFFRRKDE